MLSILIISITNSRDIKSNCNDCDINEIKNTMGCVNNPSKKHFSQNSLDYEVIFTPPFGYVDYGWGWEINSSEKHKWNNVSYADDTGLCMLNVSAMNVSEWGKAYAYAAIGGTTVATHTYDKPRVEFYFSGKIKMFDDLKLASKTRIRAFCFYGGDGRILKEWWQEKNSTEYAFNYTENPLSIDLDSYRNGSTYTIILLFEAYIEATGGSGTCYIDAFNVSLERYIRVEKIRIYDASEYGSDLEVTEYSLNWEKVKPGSIKTGYIKLRNAGLPYSKLDWEIVDYPDWGTWSFEPSHGEDLTPEDWVTMVNVTVTAPNEVNAIKQGEIKIVNKQNPDDFVVLRVTLSTPKTTISDNPFHTFLEKLMGHFPMLMRLFHLSFNIPFSL